jgi:predicted RNase H-like HicB family nuclease
MRNANKAYILSEGSFQHKAAKDECSEVVMQTKLNMVYWKRDKFWVGKLLEHPEIMTQGETLAELEDNMKDAYVLMTMDDVPEERQIKELSLTL